MPRKPRVRTEHRSTTKGEKVFEDPGQTVDDYLSGNKRDRGGAPCQMCIHPRRAEIEQACIRFNQRRGMWGQYGKVEDPSTGEMVTKPLGTNVPWSTFARECLKPSFNYDLFDQRPLMRHLEFHCDGIKILHK